MLWPIFGASNQLLASLALLAVSLWLSRPGKIAWYTVIPMLLMLVTTLTGLAWHGVLMWQAEKTMLAILDGFLSLWPWSWPFAPYHESSDPDWLQIPPPASTLGFTMTRSANRSHQLQHIVGWLDAELPTDRCRDYGPNGLQVEAQCLGDPPPRFGLYRRSAQH